MLLAPLKLHVTVHGAVHGS